MHAQNIFSDIPPHLPEEFVEEILDRSALRIERILSRGHASPEGFWYDQEHNEWVILLSGSACLSFEGEEDVIVLKPGDHIDIPAHVRHRVEWTSPEQDTVWLAVHY